jgi:hypothetical protein
MPATAIARAIFFIDLLQGERDDDGQQSLAGCMPLFWHCYVIDLK